VAEFVEARSIGGAGYTKGHIDGFRLRQPRKSSRGGLSWLVIDVQVEVIAVV